MEGKKSTVLVVDDEPLVCWSLKKALTRAGYFVDISLTAENALENTSSKSYDFVITDLKLPSMNGFDLIKKIHHDSPRTHTIMMSAYYDEIEQQDRSTSGIEAFVNKPFEINEMLCILSSLEDRDAGKERIHPN